MPDGEVGAFTFVTLESTCMSGAAMPIETLHLVRAAPSGHIDVKALQVIERRTAGDKPSIELSYVIPHYTSAVLVPWKLTVSDGSVENHVTRLEGDLRTDYTLPFMGGLGIGDDTAYTLTDDKRTIVKFDPTTGRVGWIRHVATGTIWVSMVTINGEIVMQYQGPLLDENYRPVPDAPLNPNRSR